MAGLAETLKFEKFRPPASQPVEVANTEVITLEGSISAEHAVAADAVELDRQIAANANAMPLKINFVFFMVFFFILRLVLFPRSLFNSTTVNAYLLPTQYRVFSDSVSMHYLSVTTSTLV